ncbi:4-hydroxy-3-methylbut-2-enyl diphosphate reductase [Geothrix sp. 21YS21S-4]|uniref:4-hydroxy-3-methylbut-2-enyl diphosphate reductase n=1 Tax=Geothrix sp. 21YS21S-4 TaxID=3068889 RepID=UPI0027B88541|nr:4-hydroxy-3-methylbut-2-enyl diphosphate reductase [Geothrix sp. 21YS21S-4]
MKVIVAKTAGFCWGVKRAMDAVLEASVRNDGRPVQTLGPLIHNPQALDLIGKRGVAVAPAPDQVQNGTVVIRAHGIPIQDLRGLKARQAKGELKIVNATCPEVAKVHNKIKKWSPKGYFTVILGSHGHAESVAHRSFADSGSVIVANMAEAEALTDEQLKKVLVVAQTTFTVKDYHAITDYIRTRAKDAVFENTICEDTWMRQDEARQLAQTVDAVIVVGGKASSNTKHLAELAHHYGKPVQYVETAAELDVTAFTGRETVGVLAGASTPTWLVDEVVDVLEQLGDGPSRWRSFVQAAFGSSSLLAIGAGLMTLGVHKWLGFPFGWRYPLLVGTYVLAMYLLTPFLDPLGLGAKGPARARFLSRNRMALLLTGMAALAAALGLAATLGAKALGVMAAASLVGVAYKRRFLVGGRSVSLRNIPGSKDAVVALALATVAVVMPMWQAGRPWNLRAFAAAFLVGVLTFVRTVIYEIRDMQNDQIIGKETLPIFLGKPATKAILLALLGTLLAGTLWLTFNTRQQGHPLIVALVLVICAAYPVLYLWLYHERFTTGKTRFELSVDLSFWLVGLLALV